MKQLMNQMTERYRNQGYYIQRKSQYTLVFIIVMCIYAIVNGLVEYAAFHDGLTLIITIAFVIVFFAILFVLFLKGRLLLCQYLFLLVGTGIGVNYIPNSTHFQFYTQMIMVLIVAVSIHIQKTQMTFAYTLVNAMVIFRAYYLYTLISLGYVDREMLNQSLQAALGIVLFSIIIAYFNTVLSKEIRDTKELGDISVTDTLTHLSNRAGFNQRLKTLNEQQQRYALGILDIDKFKLINDKQGHQVGDRVLITLANLMRDYFDTPYKIYRWGGEEFAVVGAAVGPVQMMEHLDEFRVLVEAHEFGLGYSMTVSGGVTMVLGGGDQEQAIIQADNALYDAKNLGRNQIVMNPLVDYEPSDKTVQGGSDHE